MSVSKCHLKDDRIVLLCAQRGILHQHLAAIAFICRGNQLTVLFRYRRCVYDAVCLVEHTIAGSPEPLAACRYKLTGNAVGLTCLNYKAIFAVCIHQHRLTVDVQLLRITCSGSDSQGSGVANLIALLICCHCAVCEGRNIYFHISHLECIRNINRITEVIGLDLDLIDRCFSGNALAGHIDLLDCIAVDAQVQLGSLTGHFVPHAIAVQNSFIFFSAQPVESIPAGEAITHRLQAVLSVVIPVDQTYFCLLSIYKVDLKHDGKFLLGALGNILKQHAYAIAAALGRHQVAASLCHCRCMGNIMTLVDKIPICLPEPALLRLKAAGDLVGRLGSYKAILSCSVV